MTIGKLTLCLSMLDGEEPRRRSIQEAIATAYPEKEVVIFIGFSDSFKETIKDQLPIIYHNNFFAEKLDKEKEILRLIFNSSTKAVVFNYIFDHSHKKDRLKLIVQLLNAGINVFTSASLSCFELCQQELKDITDIKSNKFLIPNSFLKYISRVILISNFNDTVEPGVYCSIQELLTTTTEKNIKEQLANIAFILATHINYHNRHALDENKNQIYTHLFPKTLPPILKQTVKIRKNISMVLNKIKHHFFDVMSSFINIVLALFCTQLFTSHFLENIKISILFLGGAIFINFITYSIMPTLISIVFSVLLILYKTHFGNLVEHILSKNIGIFLGFILLYIMLQNNRIIFQQREEVEKKENRLNFLYHYTEALATTTNVDEIFHVSQTYFKSVFKLNIILILQNPNTFKTQQIITPTTNTIIDESADELTIKQSHLEEYGDYEFLPLIQESIELGWIGIKNMSSSHSSLDNTSLNSAILQLTIALQRYHLLKSYQSVVLSSEKEQLRSVILSSISHDLKTPLTTIIGSCTALEELENLSEKNKMILVHTIHEASEQLNQFISNILDSSRLATDNILQQNTVVYLDDVINVVLHRSKKIIRLFDVSVTVANSQEAAVYGDFTLIQQVFYNLIENATKYSPMGGKISIVVNNVMEKVFVRIYDNGPGIIESKRNLIFDKFYRFQHTDQQKAGTGLGLSICKQIIEAYKGKIWVSDRDDGQKGAQFNIELPCAFPKQGRKKRNQTQGF